MKIIARNGTSSPACVAMTDLGDGRSLLTLPNGERQYFDTANGKLTAAPAKNAPRVPATKLAGLTVAVRLASPAPAKPAPTPKPATDPLAGGVVKVRPLAKNVKLRK